MRIRATVGDRSAEAFLPSATAAESRGESLAVDHNSIGLVRTEGPGGRGLVLLVHDGGGPRILWAGPVGLRGDPGERQGYQFETADRTGDGVPDLILAQVQESIGICGQGPALLFPRALEPRSQELRPVTLRPGALEGDVLDITATTESPGPESPPLLSALTFTAASSSVGYPEQPSLLPMPTALVDDDPGTYWAEGRAGEGRWEFVTARWTAGEQRIRALALRLPDRATAREHDLRMPTELWIIPASGPRFRVRIPQALTRSGERLWVSLPGPVATRCLSIVVGATVGPGRHTALAEIEAYSDLDFGDGTSILVAALGGPKGPDSVRLLARIGPSVIEPLLAQWEPLSPLAKKRALPLLIQHALEQPRSLMAVREAADDDDEDLALAAVDALGELSRGPLREPSATQLSSIGEREDAVGRRAVTLLQHAGGPGLGHLLRLASRPGGSERAAVRNAIRMAFTSDPDGKREAVERWADSADVPALASVALALARSSEKTLAAALLSTALARSTALSRPSRFEDRYRMIRAAGSLPAEPMVDSWLALLVTGAEEWMTRDAALSALVGRGSPALPDAIGHGLVDAYPRVRVTAVRAAPSYAPLVRRVVSLARRDSWPMVRAEALLVLAEQTGTKPLLRSAVSDPSMRVRATAVGALTRQGDLGAMRLIAERLTDDREWPSVIEAAMDYARHLCTTDLVEALRHVVRRGERPNSWGPDLDLAMKAIEIIGILGGPEAAEALENAGRAVPAGIRQAAERARSQGPLCPRVD